MAALLTTSCTRYTAAPQHAKQPVPQASAADTPKEPDRPAAVTDESLPIVERVAKAIASVSPIAEPADVTARDAAADALGGLRPLMDAAEFHIYWGEYNAGTGIDLLKAQLTQLQPIVTAKLYLSLFMFTGEYNVRQEETATVVELAASFRDKLPAGEYPHPLWNNPDEWAAYARTTSILLIFSAERLGAIMFKPDPARAAARAPASWDGRWRWLDSSGVEQPRVTKFAYVFSADNPHIDELQTAFAKLEVAMVANNCVSCHAPDNRSRMQPLTLLMYPNQALAARHSIAAVLRAETMPPGNARRGIPAGIHDETVRQDMIDKADEFDRAASEAIKFEDDRRARHTPADK